MLTLQGSGGTAERTFWGSKGHQRPLVLEHWCLIMWWTAAVVACCWMQLLMVDCCLHGAAAAGWLELGCVESRCERWLWGSFASSAFPEALAQ